MTPNEYQEAALRSESTVAKLFISEQLTRALHSVIGISTESGELSDTVKKALFYRQGLDVENFKEELGDLLWYIAVGAQACGTTIEVLMQDNIEKLKIRYPEKFTEEHAKARLDKV